MEFINGAGGWRAWSADAKAAVLDETLLPGAVVSVVARRQGLTPQQVFGWRREARRALEAERAPTAVGFFLLSSRSRRLSRSLHLRIGPDMRDGAIRPPLGSNWRSPASRSASDRARAEFRSRR
nr:transposase [Methylobacterium thuringiense]